MLPRLTAMQDDPFEDEDAGAGVLALVPRFIASAQQPFWFSKVGQKFGPTLRRDARAYLEGLGFPQAGLARLRDWREAAAAAENPDYDDPAFEAEEQLRAALTSQAVDALGEDGVNVVLTHVAAELSQPVGEAAANAVRVWGLDDDALAAAAAGAGLRAAHHAALLMLSGEADEAHPFALAFRLFERGRWPVSLVGTSFNLF